MRLRGDIRGSISGSGSQRNLAMLVWDFVLVEGYDTKKNFPEKSSLLLESH